MCVLNLESPPFHLRETFFKFSQNLKKVVKLVLSFPPDDVEIDIQNLYKAVPQLNEVFHITDKIGEGTATIHLYTHLND